ncbi:aldose epimerase family protein [Teredinibacter franksiae]|uniref:aldose epimerase family protein n=1 Tax=Teredinibacter franksiae TaxID=2761453 RepID=UPI0028AFE8C4|nr:aldose epimerase family protein [Teredinibacter franksiae]
MNKLLSRAFVLSVSFLLSFTACAKPSGGEASIVQSLYGTMPNGELVTQYVLTNTSGVEATIITYGGIITSLKTLDKNGKLGDIVLGYDNLEGYIADSNYFGALIGRYGNRIGKAQFSIEGKTYQLEVNDGENHLHGGFKGFDKKNWNATAFKIDGEVGLKMELFSPDGEQGYPGNVTAQVVYTLKSSNELVMDYMAITDKPTHINMTQHSYFNLAGDGSILDHQLTIPADSITPVDKGLIPTGALDKVENTPFDFRKATAVGKRIDVKNPQLAYGLGYDHNFVLNKSEEGAFELAAKVVEPKTGRVLEIFSEEPAIQFYSGNFLNGTAKGKGQTYEHRTGFCLEPQHFPDAPNQPNFASTLVKPSEVYSTRMSYRFSAVK